ncbi:MAG: ABC transporter ATP-binding protein [Candidatus Micrarchaeota archaeon]
MKNEVIIELENVEKTYLMGIVPVHALGGVNLKIRKGEFVAIMGPSGSGKSTLMNMVGSLDLPTKGKVLLDGQDISKFSESHLAQIRGKKIGFIFQQFNLVPSLSAMENAELPLIFHHLPEQKRRERLMKIFTQVNMEDRIFHKPRELSGGEQQRVAIVRALAVDPEVVLADEPTGNLDSKTGKELMVLLKDLNKKGKTIIMVTHDEEIGKQAQRIVRIRDGLLEKEVSKK